MRPSVQNDVLLRQTTSEGRRKNTQHGKTHLRELEDLELPNVVDDPQRKLGVRRILVPPLFETPDIKSSSVIEPRPWKLGE